MRRSTILMIYQSLLEITRQTNVSLVRGGFRLQNVDVIHNSKVSSWLASRSLDGPGGPPSPWLRRARSSLRFALRTKRRLERVTRLELATSSLARRCSTTELHPRVKAGSNNRSPVRF